jgi:hypothetical protein
MIKRSCLLALALLVPCLAYGADPSGSVSVEVVPAGSSPSPPPQAAAAGFTVLARNSDFSRAAPDIGCDDTGHHDWYAHTATALYSDCSNITWPVTDPVSGETVAQFNCTNCGKPDTSLLGARHGLSSVNNNGTQGDSFPLDGYYECRIRVAPYGLQGGWWNCWMNGFQTVQTNGGGQLEFDINEYHSGEADNKNYCALQTIHDWYTGGGGLGPSWWTCNTGKNPSDGLHKTGMLIQTNRATNTIHYCSYWDDQLMGCSDVLGTGQETSWQTQRNYIMWNVTVGCNASNEGLGDCVNMPISNIINNGGNIRVAVNGPAPTWGLPLVGVDFQNYELEISGVQGTTNANGHFMGKAVSDPRSCVSNCQFDIFNVSTGQPIPYNGAYVPGTGIWNPTPNGFNMYASYFRVWVKCSNWQTTSC